MENHRKNKRSEETSGISEKFGAYIRKAIRHRIKDSFFKDRRESRKYLVLPLDALEKYPSKPHRFLFELNKVHLGNTPIYLENEELAKDIEEMPEQLQRVKCKEDTGTCRHEKGARAGGT